ncbi:LytR C-terminal domain-containing protein [Aeromicrobium sp. Leaf350]|uniref:LytR C-terminal domain-containing protein n=1 Tax=Aeromicrobium sp. Leaf350 TaxID=2876565 RepID=UPI001E4ADDCE|nr:LytR C-terminal domain-containing protein [Aeromicrobium sp. Leaf350]
MDHRRTVSRRAFVPPVWLIMVAVVAAVAGAATIGWFAWDSTRDDDPAASASSSPTTSEPTEESPEPEPTPVPTTPVPEPPAPTQPAVDRTPGVSILNGTGIDGLASEASDFLSDAGWADRRTGDTAGSYPENTVYYPPQFEAQAQTLAQDLGITRVRPSVDGMRDDRLTAVLISRPSSLS